MHFLTVSNPCCTYTMSPCAGAMSLRGSNGRLIRLRTISVSFQPTTDVDMSRKISSPFQPLGLKPLSSYCLMKYTPSKPHIFSIREKLRFKEMKRNFLFLGNDVSTNVDHIVLYTILHVLGWKHTKKRISATRHSINLMPEGTKFNLSKWT